MIFSTLYKLLPTEQRKKAIVVLFVRVLHSLFDFIGIAILLVILLFVINRQHTDASIYFIILIGGLILLVKNIVSIFAGRQQTNWLLSLYQYYSLSLLEEYYTSGLLAVNSKGAARITYEVNSICYTYAMTVIGSSVQFIGQCLLLFLFIVAFIIYSPWIAFVFLSCLFPIIGLYCFFIRKKISMLGKEEMKAKRQQWILVENIFKGYIEIKTYLAFPHFKKCFIHEMDQISHYKKNADTYMRLSSVYMETGMVFILLFLVLTANGGHNLIVVLSIYSIAGMRIVPLIRAIINNWVQIQNNSHIVEIMNSTMRCDMSQRTKEDKGRTVHFKKEIQIKNVHFSYNNSIPLLDNFSMHLKYGEKVGVQGTSGIGKTTLLNIILGCISPLKGDILVDGTSLREMDISEWHRQIGYVSQDTFIMDVSLAENIALGVSIQEIDMDYVHHVLRQVQLNTWMELLPDGVLTCLGENGCQISGGQKQRIAIARALYKRCRLLLLDEVTSNLDYATEQEVLSMLDSLTNPDQTPMSLLIISHKEQTLLICDRIVHM